MSMIGNYAMVDEDTILAVQKGECTIDDMLYGEDDEGPDGESIDIDKAWHAIHFLLTGEAEVSDVPNVLSKAVLGGTPINDEDVGYGPVLYLTPEEVREVSAMLQPIDENALQKRYDLVGMRKHGIYPITDNADGKGFFDYIFSYFLDVKAFFQTALQQGKCIIFYLN